MDKENSFIDFIKRDSAERVAEQVVDDENPLTDTTGACRANVGVSGHIDGVVLDHEDVKDEETDDEPVEETRTSLIPKTFDEGMEYAKLTGLGDNLRDEQFRKKTAEKSSELVEADLEKEQQKINLETLQIKSESQRILSDQFKIKYGKKLDQQEYNFRSLKPILDFLGVHEPMNIFVMWFLTLLIIPVFCVAKLLNVLILKPIKSIVNIFKSEDKKDYKSRLDEDKHI